jgi:hypothetical protein
MMMPFKVNVKVDSMPSRYPLTMSASEVIR